METMKAVVKYADKEGATEIRDVPIPTIGKSDVLVEVAYVGVCGTDPHLHRNASAFKFERPFILGHEFAGTISKVGEEVIGYSIGDRVTSETSCRILWYVCTLQAKQLPPLQGKKRVRLPR